MKRTTIIGAGVAAAIVLALAINPGPGRSGDVVGPSPSQADRFELLDDGRFALRGPASPWIGAFRSVSADGASEGSAAQLEGPTIRQNVDFAATDRSYRVSARVRSAGAVGSTARGTLRMRTRCDRPESSSTVFTVNQVWQEVTATLDPVRPEGCSLGVELETSGGEALLVDRVSLADANLFNASFEKGQVPGTEGAASWKPANDAARTTFDLVDAADALDGRSVGRIRISGTNGSIAQDFVLDPSSEQIRATFAVGVRAASVASSETGTPRSPSAKAEATVAVWVICDKGENALQTIALTDAWQVVTVTVTPKAKLLRVTGPPCTVRAEVYNNHTGTALELDAARLTLESAKTDKIRNG